MWTARNATNPDKRLQKGINRSWILIGFLGGMIVILIAVLLLIPFLVKLGLIT